MKRTWILIGLLLVPLSGAVTPADAQIWKKVKEKAKEKVNTNTDKAIDKGLEKAENIIKCVVDDDECIQKAEKAGKKVVLTDEEGTVLPPEEQPKQTAEKSAAVKPGEGAWANYDFIPGERVIFDDDFAKDVVGDFPRRLEFGVGLMELVEWQGKRFLRSKSDGFFMINLAETLPERFTFEADVYPWNGTGWGSPSVVFAPLGDKLKKVDHATGVFGIVDEMQVGYVMFSTDDVGYMFDNRKTSQNLAEELGEEVWRLRIMVDGKYVKVYANEKRVANVPNANLGRSNQIVITTQAYDGKPLLIGNIRIAAGGRKLYDALAATGRVATQGIFFDTNSDKLRPESTPTLKEIGTMLVEHAELRLLIEGHTDNVGEDAANLSLSQKRADAVKQHLIDNFKIDAARLETKGFGETKPTGDNSTAEGRQNNRRVELVKLPAVT